MHNPEKPQGLLDVVALVILAAETVLVGVCAVGYVAYALLDRAFSSFGLSLAAVAAILAAGLAIFTRGFARRKRYALGGAMTWQLMQASVGVWLLGTLTIVGVVLILSALVVAIAVFRRQSDLGRRDPDALEG